METPNHPSEAQVSLKKAMLIIVAVIITVMAAGLFAGYRFFWNKFDDTPLADRQLKVLNEYQKSDPGNPYILLKKGDALVVKQDLPTALKEYQNAYSLAPNNPDVNFRLGLIFNQLKDYDKAIPFLEFAATKLIFNYPTAYNLALAYYETNQLDKAVGAYEKAMKIEPSAADTYYELSRVYQKKGDLKKALEYVEKALNFVPDYPEALQQKKLLTK